MKTISRVLRPWLLAVTMCCGIAVVFNMALVVRAQTVTPAAQWEVSALDRRLTAVEEQSRDEHVDARLRVLEAAIGEMKGNFADMNRMFYTVVAAIVGQFAVAILGYLRKAKTL